MSMSLRHFEEVLSILIIMVVVIQSDYQVKLQVSSYNNMASRCASCRNSAANPPGCCNTLQYHPVCPANSECAEASTMMMCLRPSDRQYDENIYKDITRDKLQNYGRDGRLVYMRTLCVEGPEDVREAATTSTTQHSLGGITTEYQGVQLVLVVWSNNSDLQNGDLVDIFITNITSQVGVQISLPTYRGYHGIGDLSISYRVACTNGTHGTDCSQNCTSYCGNSSHCSLRYCCSRSVNHTISDSMAQMCSCDREYTTLLCLATDNNCIGINCGRGICINEINSFRCRCYAGYQGSRCMDIVPNHSSPNVKIAVGVITVVIVLGTAAIAFYGIMYYRRNRKNKMQRLDDSFLISEDFMK